MGKKPRLRPFFTALIIILLCVWGNYSEAVWAEDGLQPVGHNFELKYKPGGFNLIVSLHRWLNQVSFEKEPDLGQRDIVRGLLPTGAEEKEHIGFAWDTAEGKLYVDLNHNGDLTDDPNGVFRNEGSVRHQYFRNIELEQRRDYLRLPYMIRMIMYRLGRGNYYCRCYINSGFASEIELYGRRWYLAVVDNMNGRSDRGDQLFLTPLDLDFGAGRNWHRLPVPETIFFDGRNYDLSFEFQPGEIKPSLQLTLKESKPPMGQLHIDGKYIARLVFEAGSSVVLLDYPEESVSIPAGNYRCRGLYLYDGQAGLFQAGRTGISEQISVPENGSAAFKAGGPLKHIVEVERTGNILALDYKLVGVGGRGYERFLGRSKKPPAFTIYKGSRKIASGQFEYG